MGYEYTTPLPSNLPENWGTGGGGGGGGTDNYNDLSNKPKINSVELAGNKTSDQLGVIGLKGIQAYETLPASPTAGMTIMYTGEQGAYETGAVYRYQSNQWVKIMSAAEAATISTAQIRALFE